MIGSRWMRRCGVAVATAGVLVAGSACEPPPPSDHIEVTRLTLPDGSPMGAPRALNARGEITTCRQTERECYVWRDGHVSVISGNVTVRSSDISDKGHVVGRFREAGTWGAFIWEDGELTILPTGDAAEAVADHVNDRGVAAGSLMHDDDNVEWRLEAAVWRDGGLVTMPEHDWGMTSAAVGINNRNQVAVTLNDAFDPENPNELSGRAAIWDLNTGKITELGTLGGDWSQANAINDRGMVVGTSATVDGETHAFLWRHGEMIDLGTLDGGDFSRPNDLNEWGQVVGQSRDAGTGEWRAFLWHEDEMTELGAGTRQPYPHEINNWGQVVGTIRTDNNSDWGPTVSGAVLWQNERTADLGDLVEDAESFSTLRGLDINDRGQIVGTARDAEGEDFAVMWEVSPTWGYYPDDL